MRYKLFVDALVKQHTKAKQLKEKPAVVTIHGFKGKADAMAAVKKSVELYKKKFSK